LSIGGEDGAVVAEEARVDVRVFVFAVLVLLHVFDIRGVFIVLFAPSACLERRKDLLFKHLPVQR
jgi:hypothetical protein